MGTLTAKTVESVIFSRADGTSTSSKAPQLGVSPMPLYTALDYADLRYLVVPIWYPEK